jgi:enterochelin esterase-like enzyme
MHPRIVLPALLTLSFMSCRPAADRDPAPSFSGFLEEYRSGRDPLTREETLARFWSRVLVHGTPLVQPADSSAVFLYRGTGDSAAITGDMTGWTSSLPMSRLEGTNLFHCTITLPMDTRLDYQIITAAGITLDPANPHTVRGGHGTKSELAMPGFQRAAETGTQTDVRRGTLQTLTPGSTVPASGHRVHVYLPAGYGEGDTRYPVVYLQDGQDYLAFAGAETILDNLIAGGSIPPVMAVFIVPPDPPGQSRRTEYAMNDAYVKFLVSGLVPRIDSLYRTLPHAGQRLVMGASFGGLISLYAAFRHPETFGNAASQSGFVSFGHDSLVTLFRSSPRMPLRVYADIGTYETRVGNTRDGDENFLAGNRRFRDVLEMQGYGATYREFHDGHSWGRWRNELPFILRHFFPWRQ